MKALRYILIGTITLILLLAAGFDIVLLNFTIVNKPLLIGGVILFAVLSSFFCRRFQRYFSRSSNKYLNMAIHTVVATVVLLTAVLYTNYITADFPISPNETDIVASRYSKERHRSRRVGRNRYVPGEKYYVYYLRVNFDSGETYDFEVSTQKYVNTRTGQKAAASSGRGIFGLKVVKPSSLSL